MPFSAVLPPKVSSYLAQIFCTPKITPYSLDTRQAFRPDGIFLCFLCSEVIIIALHSCRRILLHLITGVGVDIQGKAGRSVS